MYDTHDADKVSPLTPEQEARRHMLKLASYVPPAILGVMIAGPKLAMAATEHCGGGSVIVVSAGGQACCPCVPSSSQYDVNTCNLKRCELGNCTACRTLVFHNQNACKKATVNCASCTCMPIQTGGDKKASFWVCR